jgi:LysR family nitrogen assimilation transcriptional regulator
LDLRQLKYFVRVAELGSFTRAAAELRIAQSALSYQIGTLETELNIRLLDRHSRGASLTEAGKSVFSHACRVLQEANDLKTDAFSRTRFPSGHIVFAAPPSIARVLVPPVIERFHAHYPQVRLTMREETVDVIHEWLLKEEIDIGLLFDRTDIAGMEYERLFAEPLFLVGSAALRKPGRATVPDLATMPLVMTTTVYGWRRRLEHALQEHDLKPTIRVEIDSLSVIKELVLRGFSYTVLPCSVISGELDDGRLWALPIPDLGLEASLMMVRLRHRAVTPAGQALSNLIREEAARLAGMDQLS